MTKEIDVENIRKNDYIEKHHDKVNNDSPVCETFLLDAYVNVIIKRMYSLLYYSLYTIDCMIFFPHWEKTPSLTLPPRNFKYLLYHDTLG